MYSYIHQKIDPNDDSLDSNLYMGCKIGKYLSSAPSTCSFCHHTCGDCIGTDSNCSKCDYTRYLSTQNNNNTCTCRE